MGRKFKLATRMLSVFLVMILAIQIVPTQVFAKSAEQLKIANSKVEENQEKELKEEKEIPEEPKVLSEATDKREEFVKHFRMSDGTYQAAQYSTPVHFKDENNNWVEYDNSLSEIDSDEPENEKKMFKDKDFVNTRSDFSVRFSKKTNGKNFVKVEKDGYKLSWYYENANKRTGKATEVKEDDDLTTLEKTSSEIRYNDIYNNVDLQYIVNGDNVKENIILNSKNVETEFIAEYKIDGLTAYWINDKTINLCNENNEVIFTIEAPYMVDDNGEYCEDLSLEILSQQGNKLRVKVNVNNEWIQAEGRAFPVVVDPELVTKQIKAQDQSTYTYSLNPNKCYGQTDKGKGSLFVGKYTEDSTVANPQYGVSNSYLKFNVLPNIGGLTNKVVDAKIALGLRSCERDMVIDIYRVLESWSVEGINHNNQPLRDEKKRNYKKADYKYIANGTSAKWEQFEITQMVQAWYEGENNYGIALSTDKTDVCKSWFYSTNYTGYTENRPLLIVTYRNMSGYEDYWSYTSVDSGYGGAASVNNYNGNVVITQPLTQSAGGNLMPVDISLVYNSNKYDKLSEYSQTWEGFQTNYHMYIRPNPNLSDNASENEKKYKYYFNDADGTQHYFYFENLTDTTAKDEDGLGYTLTMKSNGLEATITDKDKNQMHFNSSGNIDEIKDANGNKIIINYDGNRISNIIDGAGRVYNLKYNGNLIVGVTDPSGRNTNLYYDPPVGKSIIYPDGLKTYFGYDGNLLKHILRVGSNGASEEYTWIEYQSNDDMKRAASIHTSHASDPYIPESYSFEYKQNETKVTDKQNRSYTYQFNDYGQTTGIVSNVDGKAQFIDYHKKASATDSKTNKILSESKALSYTPNYINDPSMYDSYEKNYQLFCELGAWEWNIDNDRSKGHNSNGSLLIEKYSTAGNHFAYQRLSTPGAGTYTLSGYINTEGNEITGSGALLKAEIWNANGVIGSIGIPTVNKTDGWEKFSVTFDLLEGQTVTALAGISVDGKGKVWFDDFQLERGESTSNNPNLITNSDYGRGGDYWGARGSDASVVAIENNELPGINKAIKLSSLPNIGCRLWQSLPVSGKKGDVFSFGMWTKAFSAPLDNGTKDGDPNKPNAKILMEFYDANGGKIGDKWENINCDVNTYQFNAIQAIAPGDYVRANVYFLYDYNINHAEVAGMFLYKDGYGQTYDYDKDGNVISTVDLAKSNSSFSYNGNQMSKMFNPSGSRYFYSYDIGNNNLNYALSSDGQEYNFKYDNTGNVTKSEINSLQPATSLSNDKTYYIVNAYSGNTLDCGIEGVGQAATTYVYKPGGNVSTDQHWKVKDYGAGVFGIKAEGYDENAFLDVDFANTNDGGKIKTWSYNGSEAQNFKFVSNGDGSFRIMTGATNYTKCLDGQYDNPDKVENSKLVKQNTYDEKKEGQKWYLFPISYTGDKKIETTSSYTNSKNFVSSTADQRGNLTSYGYNESNGTLTNTTDALGRTTSYTYDTRNDSLLSVSSGGMTNSYTYDSVSRLDLINVNNSVKYKFEYDNFGRTTSTKVGNGTTYKTLSELSYTPNNLLSKQKYGNGDYIDFSYDSLDRIAEKKYNGDANKKVTYSYNSDGNLASTADYFTNSRTKYIYDLANRVVSEREYAGTEQNSTTIKSSTDYTYADKTNYLTGVKHFSPLGTQKIGYRYGNLSNGEMPDQIYGVTWNGQEKQNYTYDGLGRLTNKQIIPSKDKVLNNNYIYEDVANSNKTTTLVKSVENAAGKYTYTYDAIGNIVKITEEINKMIDGVLTLVTYETSYKYDELNQLIRENNEKTNITQCYTYHNGNITSKTYYNYTTSEDPGIPTMKETNEYTDSVWGDLLIRSNQEKNRSVGDDSIQYDEIGNPIKMYGMDLYWEGRQLTSIGNYFNYTYNADGQRTSKSNPDNGTTEFFYNGSILAGQKNGENTITFMYDNNGDYFGFTYNGTEYYYLKNAQNDVIGITDVNGTVLGKYYYDAWGNLVFITDTNGDYLPPQNREIFEINPIRYRSYYFDSELGFYYLNTRYYMPDTGRFLNADDTDVLDADQDSLVENNLFAYCLNNPVNMADDDGEIAWWIAAAVSGAVFDTAAYLIGSAVSGKKVTWGGVGKAALTGAVTGLCFGAVGKIASKAVTAVKTARSVKISSNAIKQSKTVYKISTVSKKISKVNSTVRKLVKSAHKLKYSKTAAKHMSSRPYMNSTLTIQQIMQSVNPVKDKSLKNGLKWVTSGSYNGRRGVWELVVDCSNNTIVHFLFKS